MPFHLNKPQKFMVLLWGLATAVVCMVILSNNYTREDWSIFGSIYAVISLFLWGMVWVFADKKPTKPD